MEKVRHLCICYASVIQLASVALNYLKTLKKKNIYILLDLDYHNICRNLLPLMRWSREVRSKRRQNAFK